MARMITEVLAGNKTSKKKREPKLQFVLQNMLRDDRLKDPFEENGGTKTVIRQELQAIKDLEEKQIQDLMALQKTNLATMVTIGGKARPISYWIIWKREVAPEIKKRLVAMQQRLNQGKTISENPRYPAAQAGEVKIVVAIDEKELTKEIVEFEELFGTVDGILSMANATTPVIES